ncbi:MAG TPA: HD domain-containing protein [Gemmatimonadaceae bacterium]|jgi:2-amino-4-hydroxy-6-hydroxymethyldihydropteridine diphosphokinase|nr:HD domain-containing protein [Gemmatimonadaceae bacterium]
MSTAAISFSLPAWAQVSEKRRGHILRVTALLAEWADAMRVDAGERQAWIDAGLFHDSLKDASPAELASLAGSSIRESELLHGPAAAAYVERIGETRHGVLTAVRYHSIGFLDWDRTGRALYMADFLEPGRRFSRRDRAFLAAHVPHDFDGVFAQVVRSRLEWSLHEGHSLFPDTVALWNALR